MKKSANKNLKEKLVLNVKPIGKDVEIPSYHYGTDVGLDLRANETVDLLPGEQKNVKTGLIFEIPENHVGLIRDRAGIVTKMDVHTAAGTFDPGYRGEISIVLINMSDETVSIEKGMRIAQIVIIPIIRPKIVKIDKLTQTERGEKSFGSTGLKEIEKLGRILDKEK